MPAISRRSSARRSWADNQRLSTSIHFCRSCGGEAQRFFCRNHGFLFAGCCCHSSTCSSACAGSDEGAFTSACESANQCSHSSTAADLGGVALGVALALNVIAAGGNRNHLAVNLHRGQANRKLSGSVEP